jgi:diadenosine tetraphosphate (Ap4A) HIT family hydrolase
MNANNAHALPEIEQLGRYLNQPASGCELCESPGGETLWEDEFCRVVRVADADYPGFCRVILSQHAREMTDLSVDDQMRLMRVVFAAESAVRTCYRPDKINLASFGNVVPHLHWHIIPRWQDDRHFPQPVWGTPQRVNSPARGLVSNARLRDELTAKLVSHSRENSV